jgi:hypothetical protein
LPYSQYFFENWIFTPFKENSDHDEELDGLVEEYEVKKISKEVLRNRYNVFGWKILNIGDSEEVNTLFWGYIKNPIIYIMLNCILF